MSRDPRQRVTLRQSTASTKSNLAESLERNNEGRLWMSYKYYIYTDKYRHLFLPMLYLQLYTASLPFFTPQVKSVGVIIPF